MIKMFQVLHASNNINKQTVPCQNDFLNNIKLNC